MALSKLDSTALGTLSGDIVFADGQGIDFSATSDSSGTVSSELFDDYEEGTYTVELTDDSGNTSSTTSTGNYIKIGKLVHVGFTLVNISSSGMTSGGNVNFSLPFAVPSGTYATGAVVSDNITFSGGRTSIASRTSPNTSKGRFRGSGSAITDDAIIWSEVSSGVADIIVGITYQTS